MVLKKRPLLHGPPGCVPASSAQSAQSAPWAADCGVSQRRPLKRLLSPSWPWRALHLIGGISGSPLLASTTPSACAPPPPPGRPLYTTFLSSQGRILFDALLHQHEPSAGETPVVLLDTDAAALSQARSQPPHCLCHSRLHAQRATRRQHDSTARALLGGISSQHSERTQCKACGSTEKRKCSPPTPPSPPGSSRRISESTAYAQGWMLRMYPRTMPSGLRLRLG